MKRKVWTVWSGCKRDDIWELEGANPTRAQAIDYLRELKMAYPWQDYAICSAEVTLPKARVK